MKPLRAYQSDAIASLTTATEDGVRRMILRAPTGSGKTRIAREIVDRCVVNGKTVVFVAPRTEIIHQTSEELDSVGIKHEILQANHPPACPVYVASISTLIRREVKPPDVCFLDEAHLYIDAATKVVKKFPESLLIGLTATPARLDGRGLGEIYEKIIGVTETKDLIALKYLVPYKAFGPSIPDLRGVHTQAGDFNRKELSIRMDTARIVGDVIEHWKRLGEGRSTIVYAVSVVASQNLAVAFRSAGIDAEHVDAETSKEHRKDVVDRLRDGRLAVACNVELFTYGLDVPRVSCISMVRPTKSLALYLQMTGRGLRPFNGKENLLLLDHAGNLMRHGFPDEVHDWTLDGIKHQTRSRLPGIRTCKECFALSPAGTEVCPVCGTPFPKMSREVARVDGQLVEMHTLPAERWLKLPTGARIAALAKWIRTKRERQAYAIYCSVFKEQPSQIILDKAKSLNRSVRIAVPINARIESPT